MTPTRPRPIDGGPSENCTVYRQHYGTMYPPVDDVVGWGPGSGYPVIRLTARISVHLPPRLDHLQAWVVDETTGRVKGETRADTSRVFDADEQWSLAASIHRELPPNTDDISVSKIATKLSAVFDDPFDQEVRNQLQPPTTTWLNSRMMNVEADLSGGGDTIWTIEMEREGGEAIFEYPTSELVKRFPGAFADDCTRVYNPVPLLTNSLWPIWFDLSMKWVSGNVIVRGYDEDDLISPTLGDYHFLESDTATFHLCDRGTDDPVCRNKFASRGEAHELDLDALPASAVLCPHCSARIKRLQIDRTLREAI